MTTNKAAAALGYKNTTDLSTLKRYAKQFLQSCTKSCPLSYKVAAAAILAA